jgi:hypothetical protein
MKFISEKRCKTDRIWSKQIGFYGIRIDTTAKDKKVCFRKEEGGSLLLRFNDCPKLFQ